MILRRYLSGQLLAATFAVSALLTLILMSGRAIKYLSMGAQGRLDTHMITAAMFYLLPGFLQMIIPLSLFLGVMLVVGRLYIDNEMAVLQASGISRWQVIGWMMPAVALVTAIVALLSLCLTPYANSQVDKLFDAQARSRAFDYIQPGKFINLGGRTLYAASISRDKTVLLKVMMARPLPMRAGHPQEELVLAEQAQQATDSLTGIRYITLLNGSRYVINPGQVAYEHIRFARLRWRLPVDPGIERPTGVSTRPLADIIRQSHTGDRLATGELFWRAAMVCCPVTALLLAFPIAKVNPRQGRFLKLLPGLLLYISLIVLTAAARNAIDKGKDDGLLMWLTVIGFAVIGILLINAETFLLRRRNRPAGNPPGATT